MRNFEKRNKIIRDFFVQWKKEIKGVGTAKLTVGVRICDNRKEQYCITAT